VYQHNLVNALTKDPNVEVHTLHSGLDYTLRTDTPGWTTTRNALGSKVTSYTLENSSVPAPGHISFGNESLLSEDATYDTFTDLLETAGPFDVVHFDSIEGLPLSCLGAPKAVNASTRVTFYAHNYYAVCPQVNLWHQESSNCTDYENGAKCVDCVPHLPDPDEVTDAYLLSWMLRQGKVKPGTRAYGSAYRAYGAVRRRPVAFGRARRVVDIARNPKTKVQNRLPGIKAVDHHAGKNAGTPITLVPSTRVNMVKAKPFAARRQFAVNQLADNVDVVLATSQRTADVLAKFGVDPEQIEVCYIGTKVAETAVKVPSTERVEEGALSIGYLGYMRRDKGFYFLLEALEKAPDELLAQLRLVVAAVLNDEDAVERLTQLAERMGGIVLYDGYKHDQLPEILGQIDLGLVPVLWEDNLPQVAIEMVAGGLPIMSSDLGGAQEIGGNNPDFTFKAGVPSSLHDRLTRIASGKVDLGAFWSKAKEPVTMQQHLDQLLPVWRGKPQREPVIQLTSDAPKSSGTIHFK